MLWQRTIIDCIRALCLAGRAVRLEIGRTEFKPPIIDHRGEVIQ